MDDNMKKLALLLLLLPSIMYGYTTDNQNSKLGMNLEKIAYGSPEQPFLNIFKMGKTWLPQNASTWDTGEVDKIPLDRNGYPLYLGADKNGNAVSYTWVAMLLERQKSTPYYPAGRYVVLYDGEGTLAYSLNAVKVSSSPGRDIFNVATPTSNGFLIKITATNPNNHIRNIRVVHETQEALLNSGEIFNPTFIDKIKMFRGLRFMDWMVTNESNQKEWANRPNIDNATYGLDSGVPLEIIASLSNKLEADAYVNMPHMATDDYMTQFAALSRQLFNKNQKVYVEFSNETWNSIFAQTQYAYEQGELTFSQPVTTFEKNRNWLGMKTAQMCDIWKNAWGTENARVICIMGAQASNDFSARQALDCPLWSGGPCKSNHGINTVAIAPYFGYDVPQTFTLDQLFTEITTGGLVAGKIGMIPNAFAKMDDYVNLSQNYGVDVIAYEGGQHLVKSNNTALTNLYIAANRDARMGAAYTQYLNGWFARNNKMFFMFNDVTEYTNYGSWGMLENIMNSTSPKYQAILNANQ